MYSVCQFGKTVMCCLHDNLYIIISLEFMLFIAELFALSKNKLKTSEHFNYVCSCYIVTWLYFVLPMYSAQMTIFYFFCCELGEHEF